MSAKVSIVSAIAVGLVGWLVMAVYHSNRMADLKSQHSSQVRSLRGRWQSERTRRRAEYRKELEAAWGGGVKAAVKDPGLGIREMLRQAGTAACPQASRVDVKVDNFTAFDVYLTVREALSKEEASSVVKKILAGCGKYVNSISFVYSDNVVKMIDKRGIDTMPDWSSAELARVSELMIDP
jgi:hypothetical protein